MYRVLEVSTVKARPLTASILNVKILIMNAIILQGKARKVKDLQRDVRLLYIPLRCIFKNIILRPFIMNVDQFLGKPLKVSGWVGGLVFSIP